MSCHKTLHVLGAGAALLVFLGAQAALAQPLTLPEILKRAATEDPAARAEAARIAAAEAGVRQAGIGPQATVGADFEDFAGSGAYGPIDRAQTTFYYERTWERGGKRGARTDAARADLMVAGRQADLRRLDTLAEVQAAWVDAEAAQALVGVAEARLAVAERLQGEVSRRVGRALDPLFAAERARTAVAQARIALGQAQQAARIARLRLGSWFDSGDEITLDPKDFLRLDMPPADADASPDLALRTAAREAADARIRLEQARSVSDPTVRAGVRHFREAGDVAVVLGGSLPLGGRSANRGNVEKARAELLATEAELAVARAERDREMQRLVASRAAIADELRRIDAEVLPSAERAVAQVRDGFNRGGTAFTFLEVAEAQRVVIEAQTRRIELMRRFHLDGARLDRLTGRHLPLLDSAETR